MFARMICLVRGHRDQHVRNLVHPEFSLLQESVWRCATCRREVVLGGWVERVSAVPLSPVETLAIDPGTPELTDQESGPTVA